MEFEVFNIDGTVETKSFSSLEELMKFIKDQDDLVFIEDSWNGNGKNSLVLFDGYLDW